MPISSPAVHSESVASVTVPSPIVAVIMAPLEDVSGLSSLLSHATNARAATAIRNIFFRLCSYAVMLDIKIIIPWFGLFGRRFGFLLLFSPFGY